MGSIMRSKLDKIQHCDERCWKKSLDRRLHRLPRSSRKNNLNKIFAGILGCDLHPRLYIWWNLHQELHRGRRVNINEAWICSIASIRWVSILVNGLLGPGWAAPRRRSQSIAGDHCWNSWRIEEIILKKLDHDHQPAVQRGSRWNRVRDGEIC